MRRFTLVSLLCAALVALAFPLAADVTVRSTVDASGMAAAAGGDSVVYIKGTKMRSESGSGKFASSYILDADAQEMIVLDDSKKRAEVYDLRDLARQMQQIPESDVAVSLEPAEGTREIAGYGCDRFDLSVNVTTTMAQQFEIETIMRGSVWISDDAPGVEEYTRFWITAAERGLFFMSPEAIETQRGQAKGFAEMYRAMAARGMALGSEIELAFDGSGPMAAAMGAMSFTMTTTVTSISTDPIPDSTFEVPEGYKVTRR